MAETIEGKTRVLVTGAGGFVGSHLVCELLDQGYDVRATDLAHVFDNAKNPHVAFLKETLNAYQARSKGVASRAEFVPCDLRNINSLEKVIRGAGVVYHPAALFDLCAPEKLVYEVNVTGTKNLLTVATDAGVRRVINWSSSSIYGAWDGKAEARDEHYTISEAEMLNVYAKSKWLQEQAAQQFDRVDGLRVTSVRPANIYGLRTCTGMAFPLKLIAKGMLNKIPAYKGQGDVFSSHIHVDDVVSNVMYLAECDEAKGTIYNLAEDNPISLRKLVQIAADYLGKKISPKPLSPDTMRLQSKMLEAVADVMNFFTYTIGRSDYKRFPLSDAKSVKFLTGHHWISNLAVRKVGCRFHYSIAQALPDLINYYERTGWKDVPFFRKLKVR